MTQAVSPTLSKAKAPDLPLSLALAIAAGVLGVLAALRPGAFPGARLMREVLAFLDRNEWALATAIIAAIVNAAALTAALRGARDYVKHLWLLRQYPTAKRPPFPVQWPGREFVLFAIGWLAASGWVAWQVLPIRWDGARGSSREIESALCLLHALLIWGAGLSILFGIRELARAFRLTSLRRRKLPDFPKPRNGIVLGAIREEKSPRWASLSIPALQGNLLKTGSIGSGKSQDLLRLLDQILGNFEKRPALLAIDPKRTFVRELYHLAKRRGLADHVDYLSLHGSVRLNPIWRPNLLRDSGFSAVANTLKLASINFLGSSGDQRFWEQQSYHLLKNSLIACAAREDYFTLRDLYKTVVQAREGGLAEELVDALASRDWNEEEAHGISQAIEYFKNELGRMDEKVRTGILVTATGFLNEFQDYRVSRIFSPRREDITFASMEGAIRAGRLILLSIENEALARSIGTLLKLQFQEAVLARVQSPTLADEPVAALVMDEYQDVATTGGGAGLGDDRYLAKARESRAITIAATQSVSSLENAIRNTAATQELLQNFKTRTFGQTTDPLTVRLYQEAHGWTDRDRVSENVSESGPQSMGSHGGTVSEGFSFQSAKEYEVTAKEFARLQPFECFAQIFDGVDTSFEKLTVKPYYLKDPRTPHREIIRGLRKRVALAGLVLAGAQVGLDPAAVQASPFPTICSVVKAAEFRSCLDFQVDACVCLVPPRPCARIRYRVPQTFIEVWPHSRDTFFRAVPGTSVQLLGSDLVPFGDEGDGGSYAFQARALPVPFADFAFAPLPCGGTRSDKLCFDALSEHLGAHWRTGSGDRLQPRFLAWGLSPKACLLKGAASSLIGEVLPSLGPGTGACGVPLPPVPAFPVSEREACNAWGAFYPRHGVYEGGSRSAAALMVAARLKSLGTEVVTTVPGYPGEVWQMVSPQSSSCFREGQNLGFLETLGGIREEKRIAGRPEGYLFTIWREVSCCQDLPEVATSLAAITALEAGCAALGGT